MKSKNVLTLAAFLGLASTAPAFANMIGFQIKIEGDKTSQAGKLTDKIINSGKGKMIQNSPINTTYEMNGVVCTFSPSHGEGSTHAHYLCTVNL